MKRIFTLLLAFTTVYTFAQDCSSGRYTENIFSTVDITSNVQYGNNVDKNGASTDLFFDLYEGSGDTATNRALIIMAHGGSFIGGSKTGDDVVDLCTDLAKKGYAVASISYRLGIDGIPFPGPDSVTATEAVFRAVQDGRAAVRYFRKDFTENSNSYGIDTSMIFFSGVSAGGFIALHLAYLDQYSELPSYIDTSNTGMSGGLEGNSGNPGYSSKVKAVVNMQGALGKANWLTAGSTPLLSLHGDADGVVPYDSSPLYLSGIYYIMDVEGSSTIAARADAVGVNNCYKQFNGADHTPHCCGHANETQYYDSTITYMTGFLAQFTCGDPFTCTDAFVFSSIADMQKANSNFKVYPNPATDYITIESNLEFGARLEVYDLLGKRIYSQTVQSQTMILGTENLQPGYYFIKLIDDSGSLTQKVVVE